MLKHVADFEEHVCSSIRVEKRESQLNRLKNKWRGSPTMTSHILTEIAEEGIPYK